MNSPCTKRASAAKGMLNARYALRTGYGVFGMPFMKFTLTYDGPLPASANKPKNQAKWDIRQKLHPQLQDLWSNHPALREIQLNGRYFPKRGGAQLRQAHHQHMGPIVWPASEQRVTSEILDLCESIEVHGAWFRPLVRDSFALHCGL